MDGELLFWILIIVAYLYFQFAGARKKQQPQRAPRHETESLGHDSSPTEPERPLPSYGFPQPEPERPRPMYERPEAPPQRKHPEHDWEFEDMDTSDWHARERRSTRPEPVDRRESGESLEDALREIREALGGSGYQPAPEPPRPRPPVPETRRTWTPPSPPVKERTRQREIRKTPKKDSPGPILKPVEAPAARQFAILDRLRDADEARNALVLGEILGPPRSRRRH
jgi:hypothetical protein